MAFVEELKRRRVFRVAAIYVASAFAVLQAADLFVEALGLPAAVLTATAIVSIIGFPVALVLAWAFDVEPARTDPAADSPEMALPRRTIVLVTGLLLGGVAIGWVVKPGPPVDAGASGDLPSIAVLPFENASASPDDEFFSQGIAEELIYALDRLPGLEVKARSSTWQFAGSNVSAQQVADSIAATSVLAGRVQRSGDDVRISVELVRGADGGLLWQDRFEGTVDGLFETQARIASAIAGILQIRLDADERVPVDVSTGSSAAYDQFLRGRYKLALRNTPAIVEAIRSFEAAIAIDSTFALAWAGLGEAWVIAAVYQAPFPASRLWMEANDALDRAIQLDPGLPQPYAARGYLLYWVGRWEAAEAPLVRALELDPDYADAMQYLAEVYSRLGNPQEAERLIQRALRREPYSRGITAAALQVYSILDLDEAVSYGQRLLELGQMESGLHGLWHVLLYGNRIDEARTRAREWVDELGLPPDQVSGAVAALEGTFDAIETYRATGRPGSVHPGLVASPLRTVSLQVLVGRPDLAIREVEAALAADDVQALGILHRRPLWAMRDDPRMRALRQRMLETFSGS